VLDAAVELKKRGEQGVRFVFIGEGILRKSLIERSKHEGLDAMTRWVPSIPKEELACILPQMDAGMMLLKNIPSLYYGSSPNKFFDYIASGLPVINNYPGWLADMIQAHQCGMVVPPDNPAAFADAVVWMRDHLNEIREMGRRGRKLAETEFSRTAWLPDSWKPSSQRAGRALYSSSASANPVVYFLKFVFLDQLIVQHSACLFVIANHQIAYLKVINK